MSGIKQIAHVVKQWPLCSAFSRIRCSHFSCLCLICWGTWFDSENRVVSRRGRWRINQWVKLSLCFNWSPRYEDVMREWSYRSTHSLTSALDGGEWSASRPGRFTPRERAPVTHWIGDWVGPRAGLDVVLRRKIPSPCRDLNPDHSARSPVLYHWAIPANGGKVKCKVVPVPFLTEHHAMKAYWGSGGVAPRILVRYRASYLLTYLLTHSMVQNII
jgi:hypothetical protein